MNNTTLINETTDYTSQTDRLESLYRLNEYNKVVRVTINADKSYKNQCNAKVELWNGTEWVRIGSLYPDGWDAMDMYECVDQLLDLAAKFLTYA